MAGAIVNGFTLVCGGKAKLTVVYNGHTDDYGWPTESKWLAVVSREDADEPTWAALLAALVKLRPNLSIDENATTFPLMGDSAEHLEAMVRRHLDGVELSQTEWHATKPTAAIKVTSVTRDGERLWEITISTVYDQSPFAKALNRSSLCASATLSVNGDQAEITVHPGRGLADMSAAAVAQALLDLYP